MLCSKTRVSKPEGVGLERFLGVFTTSTGGRAYRSLEMDNGEEGRDKDKGLRKAFIVCRVIAGRVHKPMMENFAEDEFEEEIRI